MMALPRYGGGREFEISCLLFNLILVTFFFKCIEDVKCDYHDMRCRT